MKSIFDSNIGGERSVSLRHGRRRPVAPETGAERIDACLRFIAANYTRPVQLKDLVEISGYSRRGLMKAFRRITGQSPMTYVRNLRLENVRRLLAREDLKLIEIARRTGFGSVNTLCVTFQREMGVSPKKFQRQVWLLAGRSSQNQILLPKTRFKHNKFSGAERRRLFI